MQKRVEAQENDDFAQDMRYSSETLEGMLLRIPSGPLTGAAAATSSIAGSSSDGNSPARRGYILQRAKKKVTPPRRSQQQQQQQQTVIVPPSPAPSIASIVPSVQSAVWVVPSLPTPTLPITLMSMASMTPKITCYQHLKPMTMPSIPVIYLGSPLHHHLSRFARILIHLKGRPRLVLEISPPQSPKLLLLSAKKIHWD